MREGVEARGSFSFVEFVIRWLLLLLPTLTAHLAACYRES